MLHTCRKITNDGLLIPAQDGYKLSDRYYEIANNVGTVEDNRKDDTVNVPTNVPINAATFATMFNVSEKTIKRDFYVLRNLNLIKYVGNNKTGHWEVVK